MKAAEEMEATFGPSDRLVSVALMLIFQKAEPRMSGVLVYSLVEGSEQMERLKATGEEAARLSEGMQAGRRPDMETIRRLTQVAQGVMDAYAGFDHVSFTTEPHPMELWFAEGGRLFWSETGGGMDQLVATLTGRLFAPR